MNTIIRNLLTELHATCMDINETDLCAFFHISGHVGEVKIEIASSKHVYKDTLYKDSVYYSWPTNQYYTEERAIEGLTKMLDEVRKFLPVNSAQCLP